MKKLLCLVLILALILPLAACGEKPTALNLAAKAVEEGKAPDFEALRQENPEILAWLHIPAASVNAPVSLSGPGLTIETYESDPNPDAPVIVLHGEPAGESAPFRGLQKSFSVPDSLGSGITLYTPGGTQTFTVFGAGAYKDMEILKIYDNFRNRKNIPWFVDQWQKYHTMIRILDDDMEITKDDRLLVLSTGLNQTPGQQFLVLAKAV